MEILYCMLHYNLQFLLLLTYIQELCWLFGFIQSPTPPVDLLQSTSKQSSPFSSYEEWLMLWKDHVVDTPNPSILPSSAQLITTPLNVWNWHHYLQAHPNQELVQYFITGLTVGFRIGLTSQAPLRPVKKEHVLSFGTPISSG